MIEGQTAIDVPDPEPTPKDCAWCGRPATREFELIPRKSVTRNGERVWLNPTTAPTCTPCFERLSDQPGGTPEAGVKIV